MNKFILILISFTILTMACAPSNENPTDLEGKKALLKTKNSELKTLKAAIDSLESEIAALSPEKKIKRKPITLDTIQLQEFNRFVDVQASVQSSDVVNISSETGGRILMINAKEGQAVRRGQLIATLDLEAVDKQIQELEVSQSLAVTVYERQKRLWDQNIGSEIQFLEAKNNKERLEKTIESLKLQLSKRNVYAPISGVIDREFVKQGEMTSPGMPLAQILNARKLKIVADVTEKYLGQLKKGDKVKIFFPALNQEMERRITLIGRSIDPTNRTFKIEIETPNPKGVLKPNLLADVSFNDFSQKEAIVVPISLLQEEVSGDQYMFIATKENGELIARKKIVEISESYDGKVIVTKGLNPNDLIILEGARSITDGEYLQVL